MLFSEHLIAASIKQERFNSKELAPGLKLKNRLVNGAIRDVQGALQGTFHK